MDQPCPLCDSDAEFLFRDRKHEKHFTCPKCSQFIVVVTAEDLLVSASADLKAQYSREARSAPPGQIFHIGSKPVPDRHSELVVGLVPR